MPLIDVPGASGLRAYLARPTGAGPFGTVVVLHEAFGLNGDTRQQADKVAQAGYLAVAPDLYSRGGALRCLRSTFSTLLSGQGQAFADIEATRSWLAGHPDSNGKVGVVGFCMGGGFALMTAARGFDVAAPNYGIPPRDLAVLDGACPVVASYGRRDLAMRGAAAKVEVALAAAGVEHDVREYEGVGHSFLNHHRVGPFAPLEKVLGLGHDEQVAADAWSRIFAYFATYLAATP